MAPTRRALVVGLALLLVTAACQPAQPGLPTPQAAPTPSNAAPASGSPSPELRAPSPLPSVSPAAMASPSPAAAASASPSPRGLATAPPAAAGTPQGTATADLPARATLAVALATAVAGPVPVGASRVEVVNVADTAYLGGDPKTAAELYDRVLNTPPGSDETPTDSSAIDDLARFRGMLAVLATGDENGAHDQLDALQNSDPNAPLTRLAMQFWDQYGMTGELRSACAQLQPQLSVADPTFVTLSGVGVTTRAGTLCVPPGGR